MQLRFQTINFKAEYFNFEATLLIEIKTIGIYGLLPAKSATAVEYADCFSAKRIDLLSDECPGYDNTKSDAEDPVPELGIMKTIPSLPLLPDQLWPKVIVPAIVPLIGQIELFNLLLGIIFNIK